MPNAKTCLPALLLLTLAFQSPAPASATTAPKTFGWLEWTYLGRDSIRIKTKLDTGAKTSSIHAEHIVPFEQDGEAWVRFTIPIGDRPDDSDHGKDIVVERPVVRRTVIKEHAGENDERFVVELRVCIGGNMVRTPMTLADRSKFNYPLLLGRTTLAGIAVVDPGRTFTTKKRCRKRKRAEADAAPKAER